MKKESGSTTAVSDREGKAKDFLNVADLEKGQQADHVQPVYAIIYTIFGVAQLFYWNALLNGIADIVKGYYPNDLYLMETLTAVFGTTNLLAVALTVWRGALYIRLNMAAGVLLLLCHIFTGVCVHWIHGFAGVILFHIVVGFAGLAVGFYQSGQYALAACMPKTTSGWVSQGNGMSGVVTFGLWMAFSELLFKGQPLKSLWLCMGIGSAVVAVSLAAMVWLLSNPEISEKLEEMSEQSRADKTDPDRLTYLATLRLCWKETLTVFFVFYVTLFLFPALGPFRWPNNTPTQINVIMGMFQIGDFIGRSLPQLASIVSLALLSGRKLYSAAILRLILVVLFILMWKQHDFPLWSEFGFKIFMMLSLSITNGWVGTCAMINAPSAIPEDRHKGRAAAISVLGLVLGISLALWSAKLVTL